MAVMLEESAWADLSIPKKQNYVNANHILERARKGRKEKKTLEVVQNRQMFIYIL